MNIKNLLSIERIIGKLDNDFNISESDWIPRVAAWTIDALSQMNCLPLERKRRIIPVHNKIGVLPCKPNGISIKVYTTCGNEIPNLRNAGNMTTLETINPNTWLHDNSNCNCDNSYHSNDRICNTKVINNYRTPEEIAVIDDINKSGVDFMKIAKTKIEVNNPNFILIDNKIELNFDTNAILVETLETATYYDEYYDCDVPYIYDDGLLLEAVCWYILFKYLSRGSKHPVYSLDSNSQITNPFVQWNTLRVRAAASVKIALHNDSGWCNFFYNYTFLPRK